MRARGDSLRDHAHSDTATNESRVQTPSTAARSRREPVPTAGTDAACTCDAARVRTRRCQN
ncbi:hypothetical protein WJ39_18670 [Burkholderia diffusa]|nr:hypothetical protein WJ39_18670 [Burkholderia diffusa]